MEKRYDKLHSAYNRVSFEIDKLLEQQDRVLVAIEGRCGSGKTSLGELLRENYGCNLIHMDDFFLRPEQRSKGRLSTPGGNIDHERFLDEVLKPLALGNRFEYRPYSCSEDNFAEPVSVVPGELTIVEGTYSCHPSLQAYYDLRVFITVDEVQQIIRIRRRSGDELFKNFQRIWIPLEEAYFSFFRVAESCQLYLET